MDLQQLQAKLGIIDNKKVLRKSQELQRLSRFHFNSSEFGVGEICKAVLCVELACQSLNVPFDRQKAVRCSGLSEKAYLRSNQAMQNALGLRKKVDVRELAVRFGCVRLIDPVHKSLALYQTRFVAALPEARRASADFNRPVFTSVAFFLCAKKNKLNVDKAELLKLCATTESEFNHIATSMTDLCFDVLGTRKFKRESKSTKTDNDAFPGKTVSSDDESNSDDDASLDDDDRAEIPGFKRSRKAMVKESYKQWKDAVVAAKDADSAKRPASKQKQAQLNFQPVVASTTK